MEDPNNLGQRGYINPATEQPYPGSCQPYAANLSRVMDEHMKHSGGRRFEKFEERDRKFIFVAPRLLNINIPTDLIVILEILTVILKF